jgi:RND family efflux transporter MFP subunit
MRFVRRSLTGLVLALVTAGLLLLAVRVVWDAMADRQAGGGGPPPGREQVIAANVIEVRADTVTPVLTAFGEVRAVRQLELRSPQGGRIIALSPNMVEGGTVSEGEVLVRLDPAEAQANRDLAAAALAEAEGEAATAGADLALARDDLAAAERQAALRAQALARAEDIAARGAGSAAAVEEAQLTASAAEQAILSRRGALIQAEARIATAASAVARAGISLAEAERALSETVIRADFAGRLSDVAVVEGAVIGGNERLALLIDPQALEVAVRLSTQQFAQLTGGKPDLPPAGVTVLPTGADPLPARLTRLAASVGEGETGRLVFAALDAPGALQPGDFVTVAIDGAPLDRVALLPASALGGDGAVLALGPGDRLEAIPVTLVRRQGDAVIVAPGAAAGREIVAERSPLLGAGIRVTPVRAGQTAAAAAPAGG